MLVVVILGVIGYRYGWLTIQGDATEERLLEQAGIATAKGLMSCVDSDANNLLVIMSARGLNPEVEISARVAEERNIEKFRRAGAQHVYSPFSLLGRRIARALTRPRVVELDLALEHLHNPSADTQLMAQDILVVLGSPEQLKAVKARVSS